MTNSYSQAWFRLFLETRPYTEQEVAFLIRFLPNPPYSRLLDLCCGQGRHTNRLARQGYQMVGLDTNRGALDKARSAAQPNTEYVEQEMRQVDQLPGQFDAILSLWQSFGYFDDRTNVQILAGIRHKLSPGGRLILDIYHADYWERHQDTRQIERQGVQIRITDSMHAHRLTSRLEYDGQELDIFEWRLYTPQEIQDVARSVGLACILACTEYDEQKPVTSEKPSMQLIFETAIDA